MRKIILQFIMVIILFSLVSCGGRSETAYFDNAEYETSTSNEPILPQEIPIEAEEPEEIAGVTATPSWAEAYFNALNERWPSTAILMVDIDLDGIPEIFFVWHGAATNMMIDSGLSYQNGNVVNIEFYGEWGEIPTEFSLLRNKRTNELVWLVRGRFSSDAGRYQTFIYEFVDFSDFSQVTSAQVLAYDSEMILNEEGTFGIGSIYSLYLSNGEQIEVLFEEIEEQRERILGEFEIIEVETLFIHHTQVFTDDTDWQSRTLDRNKLSSHFNEWD